MTTVFTDILSAFGQALSDAAPGANVYFGRAAPLPEQVRSINVRLGDSQQTSGYLGPAVSWITDLDIEIAAPAQPQVDLSPDHAADALLAQVWPVLQWAAMRDSLVPLGVTHYCDSRGSTLDIAQALRRDTTSGTAPAGRISLQISLMHHTLANLSPYIDSPQ